MSENEKTIAIDFLEKSIAEFNYNKSLAERAMNQLDDDDFYFHLDNDTNSIYITVKHLAGNMRSRWTNFLTTDGEKSDRHRDNEFIEDAKLSKQQIMDLWNTGWQITFNAIEQLQPEDLTKTVHIRNQPHTVIQAIIRQLAHYAYHVGQIVTLAKHIKGDNWQYLTVPRGQSEQFNKKHGM